MLSCFKSILSFNHHNLIPWGGITPHSNEKSKPQSNWEVSAELTNASIGWMGINPSSCSFEINRLLSPKLYGTAPDKGSKPNFSDKFSTLLCGCSVTVPFTGFMKPSSTVISISCLTISFYQLPREILCPAVTLYYSSIDVFFNFFADPYLKFLLSVCPPRTSALKRNKDLSITTSWDARIVPDTWKTFTKYWGINRWIALIVLAKLSHATLILCCLNTSTQFSLVRMCPLYNYCKGYVSNTELSLFST